RQNWCISVDAMRSGLSSASLAGRIEILGRRPVVVLDVAHNVAAARALTRTLLSSFTAKRRTLVFAGTRDKDVLGMLRELTPHFQHVIVTQYGEKQRAANVEEVATHCRRLLGQPPPGDSSRRPQLSLRRNPTEAWNLARQTTAQDELICVTGSFFIAAELRPVILADLLAPTTSADRRESMKADNSL
ncbi:MAG: cyanophycin synthetase, partial [Planctomycetota bacterium]